MTGVLAWLRTAGDSLAARITLVFTFGIVAASIVSLLSAERGRVRDLERARLDRVVVSTVDLATRLERDPVRTSQLLAGNRILGVREARREYGAMRADDYIGRTVADLLPWPALARAMQMPPNACFLRQDLSVRVAGTSGATLPECWYVRFRDPAGREHRILLDSTASRILPSATLGPIFLCTMIGASALLSLIVARLATAPLRRLTEAAQAFSVTSDPEPIPELGPKEVRAALHTFNVMRRRVRAGFSERTQILASITHDLQTPLTRLRLRVEQVEDDALRDHLIADLAATQRLVRDGLDLAQSSESREPWSIVDIDSILSSVVEDAAEFGAPVQFAGGCGARVRVKPNALTRCLNNLVDNAVKHAGGGEVSCVREGGDLLIRVRDHGEGIPAMAMEEVFEPFRRLDAGRPHSAGGTGLGLAIARAQAQTFDAYLTLDNHDGGGLIATIRLGIDGNGAALTQPRQRSIS